MRRLLVVTLVLCCPTLVHALTRYASSNGAGSAPCTVNANNATACGISTAIPILQPGDVLNLRGGTYNTAIGPVAFPIPSGTCSGAADAPWPSAITIQSFAGETATITGGLLIQQNFDSSFPQCLIFDRLLVDMGGAEVNAFRSGDSIHHIRVQNSELRNANQNIFQGVNSSGFIHLKNNLIHGAMLDNSFVPSQGISTGAYGMYINLSNSIIENNSIYDNFGYAIHHFRSGFGDGSNGNIIRNNKIYGNGYNDGSRNQGLNAVILASTTNLLFYNNLIYNNATVGNGAAITVYASNGVQVYYNVVYGNSGPGIDVQANASNAVIKNNIAYFNSVNMTNASGTTTYNNNLCGTNIAGCEYVGNPQFQNAASANFQLLPTSPARGIAECLGAVPTDILGVNRPVGLGCDTGAYQFVQATGGPLLLFPFDEGSGTTATSSIGSFVCNLSSAGWGAGTIGPGSLSLDGTRFCTVANDPALRPTLNFSLYGWFKASTTDPAGGTIMALPNDGGILYLDNVGHLKCQLYDGVSFPSVASVATYLDNTWRFASCSYEKGLTGVVLRVNHIQVGTLPLNITVSYALSGTGNLEIGRSSGSPADYGFIGLLDQVGMRDTPLTDDDDLALYQEGLVLSGGRRRLMSTVLR